MNTKNLPRIGKGMFSTVYRLSKRKVLIKSSDPAKECAALFFPPSRLFPKINRVGWSDERDVAFYEMEYLPRVASLKNSLSERGWRLYKSLRTMTLTFYKDPQAAVNRLPSEFYREKQALHEAIYALWNYGPDFRFEISPRNVAVKSGKLILLDCFYFVSALDKAVDSKKRRAA